MTLRLIPRSAIRHLNGSALRAVQCSLTATSPLLRPSPAHYTNPSIISPSHHHLRLYSSDHANSSSSVASYHEKSDETMELILENFEVLSERVPEVDVELAQGVLSLYLPPNGSYVINKQPPNKQIWWSSPVSGPKRFDLVDGKWVYLRDGSTLGGGLREETKIVTDARGLAPVAFEGIDDEA